MDLIQSFTPESFAGYSALGAALIIPTVELLRTHLLKSLDGFWVVLLSVAVGAVYGALGDWAGFLTGSLIESIGFGAWAGVVSSGANKYLDKMAHPKKAEG